MMRRAVPFCGMRKNSQLGERGVREQEARGRRDIFVAEEEVRCGAGSGKRSGADESQPMTSRKRPPPSRLASSGALVAAV
ncbi:hypothetical protein MRX96_025463 [Rhipicephalus microplus]